MPPLTAAEAWVLDAEGIRTFNARPGRDPKHHLHTRTGAAVPTPNITTAPVVLLLANPGYTHDNDDTPDRCDEWEIDGWPLAYLHPEAPKGGRIWTHQRLRPLVERFGAEQVAQKVALVQLIPWASFEFYGGALLPSRAHILSDVQTAGRRGALLVVLRCRSLWAPALNGADVVFGRNPRAVYVSPRNLAGDRGFERVCERLQ
jgi:hypothetical protein